ncbi:hypothetical protein SISSUDRAFT_984152, partial [Sistotremastrum suecicum HHB10207 ss-3]
LEKQLKELKVQIVDLETRSYAAQPRPVTSRRLESRIEELTNKLNDEAREKTESQRMTRSADKSIRDAKTQLMESERQRLRLQEEIQSCENKIVNMRKVMDEMQTMESNLQLEKRRAERDAAEYKQRALRYDFTFVSKFKANPVA